MYKVYACLLGQWTELTKDYQIGYNNQFFSPYNWAKDGYIKNTHDFIENSFYDMSIVQIIHENKKNFHKSNVYSSSYKQLKYLGLL